MANVNNKIIVTADTKQAESSIASLNQKLLTTNNVSKETTGGVGGFVKSMGGLKVGALAAAAAVTAMVKSTQGLGKLADYGDKVLDLEASFKSLSKATGQLSSTLLNDLNSATDSAISNLDLMKAANTAMSLNLESTGVSLVDLADKVKNFADATGRDATSTLDQFIRAMATGRTTTLASIGIFVDAKKATENYAASLGKTVSELSSTEIQAAKANAAMESLAKTNNLLGDSGNNAGDQFQTVSKVLTDLYGDIAKGVANSKILTETFRQLGVALKSIDGEGVGAFIGALGSSIVGAVNTLTAFASAISQTASLLTDLITLDFSALYKKFEIATQYALSFFSVIDSTGGGDAGVGKLKEVIQLQESILSINWSQGEASFTNFINSTYGGLEGFKTKLQDVQAESIAVTNALSNLTGGNNLSSSFVELDSKLSSLTTRFLGITTAALGFGGAINKLAIHATKDLAMASRYFNLFSGYSKSLEAAGFSTAHLTAHTNKLSLALKSTLTRLAGSVAGLTLLTTGAGIGIGTMVKEFEELNKSKQQLKALGAQALKTQGELAFLTAIQVKLTGIGEAEGQLKQLRKSLVAVQQEYRNLDQQYKETGFSVFGFKLFNKDMPEDIRKSYQDRMKIGRELLQTTNTVMNTDIDTTKPNAYQEQAKKIIEDSEKISKSFDKTRYTTVEAVDESLRLNKTALEQVQSDINGLDLNTFEGQWRKNLLSTTETDLKTTVKDLELYKKTFKTTADDVSTSIKDIAENTKELQNEFRGMQSDLKLDTAKQEMDDFLDYVSKIAEYENITLDVEIPRERLNDQFNELRSKIEQQISAGLDESLLKFKGKISDADIEFMKQSQLNKQLKEFDDNYRETMTDAAVEVAEAQADAMKEAYESAVDYWESLMTDVINGDFDFENLEQSLKQVASSFGAAILANTTGIGAGLNDPSAVGANLAGSLLGGGGANNSPMMASLQGMEQGIYDIGAALGASFGMGTRPLTESQASLQSSMDDVGTMAAVQINADNIDKIGKSTEGSVEAGFAAVGTAIGGYFGGAVGAGIGAAAGDALGKAVNDWFGSGMTDSYDRQMLSKQVEDIFTEKNGRGEFATTEGYKDLSSGKWDFNTIVPNLDNNQKHSILDITEGIASLFTDTQKKREDLGNIFLDAVGNGSTFNETLLNTRSLFETLGVTTKDVKESLKSTFLEGTLGLGEFGAQLGALNTFSAGLFVPGKGGISDAIETFAAQISDGKMKFAVESLEVLFNEASEEGINSMGALVDYLSDEMPSMADVFASLPEEMFSSFENLSEASADQLFAVFSQLDPFMQKFKDLAGTLEDYSGKIDPVVEGYQGLASSIDSVTNAELEMGNVNSRTADITVSNIDRQITAYGRLQGQINNATKAQNNLNNSIRDAANITVDTPPKR